MSPMPYKVGDRVQVALPLPLAGQRPDEPDESCTWVDAVVHRIHGTRLGPAVGWTLELLGDPPPKPFQAGDSHGCRSWYDPAPGRVRGHRSRVDSAARCARRCGGCDPVVNEQPVAR